MASTTQLSKEKRQSIFTLRHEGQLIRSQSWSNCWKETTTEEEQQEEETCLGQETQGIDIKPVEICILV